MDFPIFQRGLSSHQPDSDVHSMELTWDLSAVGSRGNILQFKLGAKVVEFPYHIIVTYGVSTSYDMGM